MTSAGTEYLSNGMAVAVAELPSSHHVLVNLLVRVGSRFESPANNGISHFLEHILFRGNSSYPSAQAISAAFERVGGLPNAITGVEATEFYFQAHPGLLAPALEALVKLIWEPAFLDIEKEQGIVHDEILYDYNENGELIHIGSLSAKLLWPSHPLGMSVTGTAGTLNAHDEGALRAHHARHFTPENMILGVAGKVDREKVMALAEGCFGGRRRGGGRLSPLPAPEPAALGEPRIKTVPDKDNQFHLQFSFAAPGYNAPEESALLLLNRLLDDGPNSRLQSAVRDEGALAYHVAADYTGFQDIGQCDISTTVKAERLPEMLRTLVDCLVDFRQDGPGEDELALAKQRHRFEVEFSRDSTQSLLDRHAWPLLYGKVRSEQEELELMEQVSREEIQQLAQRIFRREKLHAVLVGPVNSASRATLDEALKRL